MCDCIKGLNMKKRRVNGLSSKGIQGAAAAMLPIAGGYLVGEILSKQLTFLSNNPTTGALVKIGAGIVLAANGSGMVSGLGVGLATNGAVGAILPSLQKGGIARLLPPGVPSALVAGVGAYEKDGVKVL